MQREGGTVDEIRPGDVVWFPPGEKHWHGASPHMGMPHIAIQETLDDRSVDWEEKCIICLSLLPCFRRICQTLGIPQQSWGFTFD